MKKCWKIDNWYPNIDGLIPHAKNFFDICSEDSWYEALKNNCVIKDVYKLNWIDFRNLNHWNNLKGKKEDLLNNNLDDYKDYILGSNISNIFPFDNSGDLLISSYNPVFGTWVTEKDLISNN